MKRWESMIKKTKQNKITNNRNKATRDPDNRSYQTLSILNMLEEIVLNWACSRELEIITENQIKILELKKCKVFI